MPTKYTISGTITTPIGKPLPGLTVKAFDWNLRIDEKTLGKETTTDAQGKYTISYTDLDLKAGGREVGGADLIVRVYERERKLSESKMMPNAEDKVTIDLIVPLRALRQQGRANLLRGAVKAALQVKLDAAVADSGDSWESLRERLAEDSDFDEPTLRKLEFTHRMGEIADDHEPLVAVFQQDNSVKGIRDLALGYNRKRLAELIRDKTKNIGVPEDAEGDDDDQKMEQFTDEVAERIFRFAAAPVFQRLVRDKEIDVEDDDAAGNLRKGLQAFFSNRPDFDIRRRSVLEELEEKDALKGVTPERQEAVKEHLKRFQRVAALSPDEVVAGRLVKLGLTSAYEINDIPANTFVKQYAKHLGGARMAERIHRQAQDISIRNSHTWMAMRQELMSPSIAMINGGMSLEARKQAFNGLLGARQRKQLSYEALFGSVDICECNHCNSVYSPAAYLVDLFQYLRNNNLDPDNPNSEKKSIKGTPLEKLFQVRPDLGKLELSCENTNTVLPYIDLVNEVLESYLSNLEDARKNNAKKVDIDVHNVVDETTGELLSEPQHTNYDAYRILQKAVYPFSMPYDQPVEATREYLRFLGTSRHELMKTFRTEAQPVTGAGVDAGKAQKIADQENIARQRAIDAEALGLTEEEYFIITENKFLSREYYNLKDGANLSQADYMVKMGLQKRWAYYGMGSESEMVHELKWVKPASGSKQLGFLRRTGIQYTDLIDLLKTNACNPNQLPDDAQDFFNRIRTSYQQLAALIKNPNEPDYKKKYAPVIAFLSGMSPGALGRKKLFDPKEVECWVYRYFERAGKQIVLESDSGLDSCDLGKVQLKLLNGGELSWKEHIVFMRFIRLWRKMGWTIYELDQAITGLSKVTLIQPDPNDPCKPETASPFGYYITPAFLHQLGSIKQLQKITGIELPKLLTFWAPIGTEGERSLYKRLFIKHNLKGIDDVFEPNKFGLVLTENEKISDHIPVLMAALNIAAEDIDIIRNYAQIQDALTLDNVSILYRHNLLAKAVRVKIKVLPGLIDLITAMGKDDSGHPFKSAEGLLLFMERYQRVLDAGFKPQALHYALHGVDDPERPWMPDQRTVLSLAIALRNALLQIENEHPDIPPAQPVTDDLLRSKLGLLFDQALVEKIVAFLRGTLVFGDNTRSAATKKDFTSAKDFYRNLAKTNEEEASNEKGTHTTFLQRVKYEPSNGLQIAGILDPADVAKVRKMLPKTLVPELALNKILGQPTQFFEEILQAFFPADALAEARTKLLAADKTGTEDTGVTKPIFFLRHYLPYLREQMRQKQVAQLCATAAKMDVEVARLLLMGMIKNKQGEPLYQEIVRLKDQDEKTNANKTAWEGYFIPLQDGHYRFVVDAIGEVQMKMDGKLQWEKAAFKTDEEGIRQYRSARRSFKAGYAYLINIEGYDASGEGFIPGLKWRLGDQPANLVPANVLYPALRTQRFGQGFEQLYKAGLIISGLGLDAAEIEFFQTQGATFNQLDFNAIAWPHWLHLEAYKQLRSSLPQSGLRVLDFLRWAHDPDGPENLSLSAKVLKQELVDQIAKLTEWSSADIRSLIHSSRFNLDDPLKFRDGQNLFKLREAMAVAGKIGTELPQLFTWAQPSSDFTTNLRIGRCVRKAIHARYQQEEWEDAIKPVSDELRKRQRDAMVSFLLIQPEIINAGVYDADGLFEYFLIDVQMDSCMETSRIKQAISSVQLFVQQCLLGLRANQGVPADRLDDERWEWMQRYRVWEANRKVFLYPENWIEPELRDDKSPFFQELEAELLQNDISKENVEKALISYLHKVNEVAKLEVVGMYQEFEKAPDTRSIIHVFGRTESAPYIYYYRRCDNQTGNWSAWEKMEMDIPSYDHTDQNDQVIDNGTYLTPVVWNNRLMVFFPILMKKSKSNNEGSSIQVKEGMTINKPQEYWEIKMGWSEYKQGKWTQKQISKKAIGQSATIKTFKFLPYTSVTKTSGFLEIWCVSAVMLSPFGPPIYVPRKVKIGKFEQGPNELLVDTDVEVWPMPNFPTNFGFCEPDDQFPKEVRVNNRSVLKSPSSTYQLLHSLQLHQLIIGGRFYYFYPWEGLYPFFLLNNRHLFFANYRGGRLKIETFYHPQSKNYLGILNKNGLDKIMTDYSLQNDDDTILFSKKYRKDPQYLLGPYPTSDVDFGQLSTSTPKRFHEQKGAYAIYNWELFFHAVALTADRLHKSQRFEEAMEWWHYIFNPIKYDGTPNHVWQFRPFRETNAKDVLEGYMTSLDAGESDENINEWRDNPFLPHLIARGRTSSYMQWVVMRYLDNLVAWGDYLFRQDTIESINQATQLYIMAGHILGPRPEFVPKRGIVAPKSFMDLVDKWDAFSNTMVNMEHLFPYSNKVTKVFEFRGRKHNGNAYGFSTGLYFCLPSNPKLLGYWDTVADRLFKIRHCLNIEGVFRKLALFEPPIDPALLVLAASQGLSIGSVLNDLNTPAPNYRFNYLLQKALELTNEVKSLGGAMLSALEKKDNETMSLLRATHETRLLSMTLNLKKLQLEEAESSLGSLQVNRRTPEYRLQYYQQLVGEDVNIPGIDAEFKQLEDKIEPVKEASGLKLIAFEKEDMDKSKDSAEMSLGSGISEALAGIFHAVPNFQVDVKPIGIGSGLFWGGTFLGHATSAVAKGLQIKAGHLSFQSNSAGKKGGFLRQLQDRIFQANLAGYELMQIDKQITAQKIRVQLAQQEIANQEMQIEQAREVEAFMRDKYSNEQLYQWMSEQIKATYYEVYKMAYDMAKKAEKVFRFEKGLTTSNYIQFGYWNSARDGLLSGERLYLSLKQLENAYIETKGHDFEINKPISLVQINPLALIQLKETGACEFELPETLFDLDYPGHYKRLIKTVAVTIPCIAGPYTSLNCTLRLQQHEFRKSNIAGQDYAKRIEESDERFVYSPVPVTAIAVSQGQNDSGVFELNFRDERFMPFEGAGAISRWRLELPKEFRAFDYDTISDIILHLRYTACEGGEKLRQDAISYLSEYVKNADEWSKTEGLFRAFSFRHEFPNEWYRFLHPEGASAELLLGNLHERLPFFAKYQGVKSVTIQSIRLFTDKGAFSAAPQLQGPTGAIDLQKGAAIGNLDQFALLDVGQDLKTENKQPFGQWKLTGGKVVQEPRDVWMVVQYGVKL